ncbi:MAG: DUF563 domain-containing protein [Elainellaceae cyanobacterium]
MPDESLLIRLKRLPKRVIRSYIFKLREISELYGNDVKSFLIPEAEIPVPEVEEMRLPEEAKFLGKSPYPFPGGYTALLENVMYDTVSGVLMSSPNVIIEDSVNADKTPIEFRIRRFFLTRSPERLPDSEVYSVFRSKCNSYYHMLIDNMPRLYLLGKSGFSDIKLLCPGTLSPQESFIMQRLLPENVQVEHVEPGKTYLLPKLLFPSIFTDHFSGYLPKEYLDFMSDRLLPKRPRKRNKRIFISRVKNDRKYARCILNEKHLYDAIQGYRFEKYCLEKMSMEAQIELFYDAEIVLGAHGAGLSNVVFSDKITLLELYPSQKSLPYFYFISKALGHQYVSLHGSERFYNANFAVDVEAVVAQLDRLLSSEPAGL